MSFTLEITVFTPEQKAKLNDIEVRAMILLASAMRAEDGTPEAKELK